MSGRLPCHSLVLCCHRFTTTSRPDWSLELLAPLAVSRTTTTTTPSNPPTQPDPPTSPAPSKATVGRGAAAAASTATNPTPEARPAPGAEGTQPRAAARPWWRALCCVASTAAEPELPRGMDAAQLERIASRRRRSVSSKHSRALPAVADVDAAATGTSRRVAGGCGCSVVAVTVMGCGCGCVTCCG